MQSYIDFLDRNRYKIVIFVSLIVMIFSISLKNLGYEGNYRIWFDKDSKILKDYDNFRDRFSGDDTFVVAFKDPKGIFNKKAIKTILDLTEEFQKIDGVERVDALTNYQYIKSEDDDLIVEDFIVNLDNLQEKKSIALKDNLILNRLISADGKTALIAVKLSSSSGVDEEVNIYVMKKLKEIVTLYEKMTGYKFYISGTPAITASLVTISQHDALLLMPFAVIAVVVMLYLVFRDFMGIVVPSVVIVFTFLLVLSIQMILGYKLNNFTVNIPSFISAIAIADSMHLFLAWVYYRSKNMRNKMAVYMALKTNLLPIAMTSFTTAVGFATLGISKIEPISTLGIAITSGALIALILSVTLAPAILLMLKDDYRVKLPKFLTLLNIKGYGAFIERNSKKIVAIFLLLFVVVGYGLKDIRVDSNSIKYFSKDTIVRSGSDFIEKSITGPLVYEVVIDTKEKNGVKNPDFLKRVSLFEDELMSHFPNVRFSTSLKDIIERLQSVLNSESKESIPNDRNLIAQYLLLYSMSLPQGMEINDKIDVNERFLRVTLYSNVQDTSKDLEMIKWIEKWWSSNGKYSANVQGQTAIFAYMQSNITQTLILSITSTLIIVVIAMLLIFKRLKMVLLFIIPNVAPIVLVAGVMGYLGINIDIGVAISASVILGIAVDDTIHFFSKYFTAIKSKSFEQSIDYVINHSGSAMILTTLILSVTFLVFTLSDFVPNVNFAIVTVIALNIALLLDLVLLPALLALFLRVNR
ncbi:efflux RND transporter permease subunit [Hydrogenimonas thermophila]|uniref:SSD domain-containing protein n=1 Tax=Hydrogenimonas thermophila TaxID=223786 RepID=A0A1I5SV35_9BACT|nr:MMPL family transporter [Hydrogenimonas thermophila]SFP74096.1 hypothetical protein SAMN05216234_13713 [Hydrogenimonas thermophila]